MDPILDHVLSEIIQWRLQYLEDTDTDDEQFEFLKNDYLKVSLGILGQEGIEFSEVELADYLYGIFEAAKERARNESEMIHQELDDLLPRTPPPMD